MKIASAEKVYPIYYHSQQGIWMASWNILDVRARAPPLDGQAQSKFLIVMSPTPPPKFAPRRD